ESWYRAKYGPWPEPDSAYGRPLSLEELVGIHWFNRGNEARHAGHLATAARAYARAALEFPTFAEAHASLGAIRQSCGDLAEAEAAYGEAARLRPDLPGLERNVELLRRQRETGESGSPPDACRQPDRP
ncbi:MAG TPA: hypothetical protein VIM14_07900, partial [Polyangia bacterium]